MKPFTTLTGIAAPLDLINIDTDMIIPKQFLKTIKRTGLGEFLFYDMRFNDDGSPKQDFVLNQKPWSTAQILVAGENFGCGSSREHAPWALMDFGIKCVIAASYADIFYNNCFKNGILPIVLAPHQVDKAMAAAKNGEDLTIDLYQQNITGAHGLLISFDIDDFRKHRLLEGLDDIGMTLQHEADITAYETRLHQTMPWILHALDTACPGTRCPGTRCPGTR